ncbi:MAG: hypothetical protein JEZ07_18265 [Phycisphaerae bacterium]|nr:hypothetical protein [Phycisphaerae bacterium]
MLESHKSKLIILVAMTIMLAGSNLMGQDAGPSKSGSAVSKYRIQKLITDLNNSEETNKAAQKELVEIGRQAVPALLEQVKLYVDPSSSNIYKSARALNVIRKIRSPQALPLAKDILLNFSMKKMIIAKSSYGYEYDKAVAFKKWCGLESIDELRTQPSHKSVE